MRNVCIKFEKENSVINRNIGLFTGSNRDGHTKISFLQLELHYIK